MSITFQIVVCLLLFLSHSYMLRLTYRLPKRQYAVYQINYFVCCSGDNIIFVYIVKNKIRSECNFNIYCCSSSGSGYTRVLIIDHVYGADVYFM